MSVLTSIESSISPMASLASPGCHHGVSPMREEHPSDDYGSASFVGDESSSANDEGVVCINKAIHDLNRCSDEDADCCYDEEEFEDDEDLSDQLESADNDPVTYEDSFEEDESDLGTSIEKRALSASDASEVRGSHNLAVEVPEMSVVNEWARSQLQSLCSRVQPTRNDATLKYPPSTKAPLLPQVAVDHVRRCLHRQKNLQRQDRSVHETQHYRLPTSLVERARLQKLLVLTSQPLVKHIGHPRENRSRSLSTFCSIKISDLEGKLATARLSDMCARWERSPDGDHVLSQGTLEFLASAMNRQRQVIRGSTNQDAEFAFAALKTQATSLDRAVQAAKDAVGDSRSLRAHAERILRAKEAHVCRCNFS